MKKREMILLLILLTIDQLSKYVASIKLELGQSMDLIQGFFSFTYTVNTGGAWSIFEGRMIFFYIITIIAVIGMGYYLWRTDKKDWITRYAIIFMMAGALGNFIDRLYFQYVRDFISFVFFNYQFPIFNVADMALCFGVFLLAIEVFISSKEQNK